MTTITIKSTKETLQEVEGEFILMAKGNSKAKREGKQVQLPDFILNDVPNEFQCILKDALLAQAKKTLASEVRASTDTEKYSASALARQYEVENKPIDWKSNYALLGSLLEEMLLSKGTAKDQAVAKANYFTGVVQQVVTSSSAGNAVIVDVKNKAVMALEKIMEWLPNGHSKVDVAMELIDMVTPMIAGVETCEDIDL